MLKGTGDADRDITHVLFQFNIDPGLTSDRGLAASDQEGGEEARGMAN